MINGSLRIESLTNKSISYRIESLINKLLKVESLTIESLNKVESLESNCLQWNGLQSNHLRSSHSACVSLSATVSNKVVLNYSYIISGDINHEQAYFVISPIIIFIPSFTFMLSDLHYMLAAIILNGFYFGYNYAELT